MATRSEVVGQSHRPRSPLRRLGLRLAMAGDHLALYAMVLVLLMIGGLKFTAYEAEAIRRLSKRAR